jgi:hypothetical protein
MVDEEWMTGYMDATEDGALEEKRRRRRVEDYVARRQSPSLELPRDGGRLDLRWTEQLHVTMT